MPQFPVMYLGGDPRQRIRRRLEDGWIEVRKTVPADTDWQVRGPKCFERGFGSVPGSSRRLVLSRCTPLKLVCPLSVRVVIDGATIPMMVQRGDDGSGAERTALCRRHAA